MLNTLPLGPIGTILTSTIFFVLIHFLTNRGNIYQVVSWIVSGVTLMLAYLLSGSIWVPIILHYATDATNVLVFNITGQFSFFKTSPALRPSHLAAFRVIYGVVTIGVLVTVYGTTFRFV